MDKKMDMRRRDRQLSEEEAREVLQQAQYGVLSTVCPDGTPYGVPLNFALEDGRIYLHGANAEGQKIVNLRHCPDACFTVVSSTKTSAGEVQHALPVRHRLRTGLYRGGRRGETSGP